MTKAEKIYTAFFGNLPSYSSDIYAEGVNGSVTINNERITVLDSDDNYIIKDIDFGTLKNIVLLIN
jgi:hypothetical protein